MCIRLVHDITRHNQLDNPSGFYLVAAQIQLNNLFCFSYLPLIHYLSAVLEYSIQPQSPSEILCRDLMNSGIFCKYCFIWFLIVLLLWTLENYMSVNRFCSSCEFLSICKMMQNFYPHHIWLLFVLVLMKLRVP